MFSKDRKTDLFHCPVCLFQTGQVDGPFSRYCLRVCLSRLSETDGTGRLAIFTVPSVPSCSSETLLFRTSAWSVITNPTPHLPKVTNKNRATATYNFMFSQQKNNVLRRGTVSPDKLRMNKAVTGTPLLQINSTHMIQRHVIANALHTVNK